MHPYYGYGLNVQELIDLVEEYIFYDYEWLSIDWSNMCFSIIVPHHSILKKKSIRYAIQQALKKYFDENILLKNSQITLTKMYGASYKLTKINYSGTIKYNEYDKHRDFFYNLHYLLDFYLRRSLCLQI